MLTESGGVFRYVFLVSADLRQDMLDVGGGGRPVFSSWEFVGSGGQKSGDEFGPITAGHVERGMLEWVDSMLQRRQKSP